MAGTYNFDIVSGVSALIVALVLAFGRSGSHFQRAPCAPYLMILAKVDVPDPACSKYRYLLSCPISL